MRINEVEGENGLWEQIIVNKKNSAETGTVSKMPLTQLFDVPYNFTSFSPSFWLQVNQGHLDWVPFFCNDFQVF